MCPSLASLNGKDETGGADKAYEEAQRQDFLSWRECFSWQCDRHRHFLAGAATVAVAGAA